MSGEVATSTASAPAIQREAPFQKILCGIDGSRSSHEAARQAAALVAPGGLIELIAIADEWGSGLAGAAVLSKDRARRALDEMKRELRGCGAALETRIVSGHPPYEMLMSVVGDHDLLVVARHTHARLSGPMVGSTASNLAHRAHIPLLIAVRPPNGLPFPGRILVAADGPGHPERAVRLAGMVARQHGSDVTLVRLNWSHARRRPELAEAVAELTELGVEPVEILTGGLPRRQIPLIACRERASLVIVGSRGLSGARALGSISERVAHDSPCSVLIVRPPAAETER